MVASVPGSDYGVPLGAEPADVGAIQLRSARLTKARERLVAATVDSGGGIDEITGMRNHLSA